MKPAAQSRIRKGLVAYVQIRFVGLDVHAETIAVAVAESGSSEIRSWGTIPNRPESVRKLIRKIGEGSKLKCCYEAGPTGYVLYWQLPGLRVECEVIAPSLIPTKAGAPRQDRSPPGCRAASALLPRRGADPGVGAG